MKTEKKLNKDINYIKKFIESINFDKDFCIKNNEQKQVIGYLYYTYITIDNIKKITKEFKNYKSEDPIEKELFELFNNIILKIGLLKLNIFQNNTTNDITPFLTLIKNNRKELDNFIKEKFKEREYILI